MTPTEAAEFAGCSRQQIVYLIRRGKLKARRIKSNNQHQYRYEVRLRDILAYRDSKQRQGWPRGKSRKGE